MFVQDKWLRPYGGDVIAIVFVYYLLRSFLNIASNKLAFAALAVGFMIELAQYFNIVQLLQIQHIKWLRILIGNSFSWADLLCYVLGYLLIRYVIPQRYK
ncbi:DUF2809 domain-containing protein [Flavobacterium agricola]|uniref:DUF2809 domain-containing protein n=1 Tax=Flavobacterium agricola TaxID=2870839 RepID=A0ABY6LZU5_9FLAO|nr:DUF2809 domain-containing protein [Flavobacterium agricola]UYW00685.1 DUF2809 domain-containing protein [Flavobacterium agricola]